MCFFLLAVVALPADGASARPTRSELSLDSRDEAGPDRSALAGRVGRAAASAMRSSVHTLEKEEI